VKKKDIVTLKIEYIRFPNKGYGFVEGEKVVVKNTIPGQIVSAQINKKRPSGIEGRLLEVVEKSPMEQEIGCSHFEFCGGCSYQRISHEDELKIKEGQVLGLLEKAGVTGFSYEGIVPAPHMCGYRNKCEFSFGDEEKEGPLALGMRKRNSFYEVVTLKDCNIVDGDYLQVLKSTLKFFQERNVSFYHKARHDGVLRHLVVRKSAATGEILVNLITNSVFDFSMESFKDMLLGLPLEGYISGVLHTANDSIADVVQGKTTVVYGKDFFMEKLFGLQFRVSAFSFFQTNSLGAEKLYDIVRDFAGNVSDRVVFDLYCGTGTIGQIMAEKSKKVIGIELVEEAIVAANENAVLNGLHNCEFIAGDVLKKVDELQDKPDLIIVDPPREGIHPKAIGKIIDFHAPQIVYVSCKPTSLARDLEVFQAAGYRVERVKLMDMFPRTNHVECIILMTNSASQGKK